jgi:hypothetical protein
MLEKRNITPSSVGIASVELASIWRRVREIMQDAPYADSSHPNIAEHARLNLRGADIMRRLTPRAQIRRLTRLAEDQIARENARMYSGPSLALNVRFNTGAKNPFITGPKGTLPGPRPGEN